ncbi:NepR family anti-sigma factor [Prosthecomicrobium sp. N25]|uniref:NepR family anti-sigma factor n=1 Tax=Prosthecomicrobium sp. N25 TaxID=3129254 RepID=UPI003076C3D8
MKDTQRRQKGQAAALEANLQAHLGRQLRKIYDETLSEPIPDRFKALIDALDDGNLDPPPGVFDTPRAHGTSARGLERNAR